MLSKQLAKELVEAGIHFGHRVSRWNPKMEPYIFAKRNLIHIINIKETIKGILRARKFLTQLVASGKDVLFVGTKRQAKAVIEHHANRCGMHYVNERWLGGTLTNFRTIRSRLSRLEELEQMETSGAMASESKKMQAALRRQLRKIRRNLQGIRKMDRLPGALVVVDVRREHIAVREAKKLSIPTVCLIDTDSDPDLVDIPIPGNDDAMRAIDLVVGVLADAVLEGKSGREAGPGPTARAHPRRSRRPPTARASAAAEPAPVASDRQPSAVTATGGTEQPPDSANSANQQQPPPSSEPTPEPSPAADSPQPTGTDGEAGKENPAG